MAVRVNHFGRDGISRSANSAALHVPPACDCWRLNRLQQGMEADVRAPTSTVGAVFTTTEPPPPPVERLHNVAIDLGVVRSSLPPVRSAHRGWARGIAALVKAGAQPYLFARSPAVAGRSMLRRGIVCGRVEVVGISVRHAVDDCLAHLSPTPPGTCAGYDGLTVLAGTLRVPVRSTSSVLPSASASSAVATSLRCARAIGTRSAAALQRILRIRYR